MRTIPFLLVLAALSLQACGGGGDAGAPIAMPVATQPTPDPKDCTALVKLGGKSACQK